MLLVEEHSGERSYPPDEDIFAFENMEWTRPQFTPQQVNRAGRTVASIPDEGEWREQNWEEWHAAIDVLENWRSSHSYPLNTFQINLRRSARRIDGGTLVSQRLKRYVSMALKLRRFKTMKLSQMQDIGGCRAVLNSCESVKRLCRYYTEISNIKHELATQDDYIESPRASGYRGVHLVYRYFSDREATAIFNGLKIEMQLRSLYQHAWATAVETVDTFTDQALKSSLGDKQWERFFALMGTAVALRESGPPVPGTPTNRRDLVSELRYYADKLNVVQRLQAYPLALRAITGGSEDAHYYLLKLIPATGDLIITGFKRSESEEATRQYSEAEELARGKSGTDAVLVSVDSLNTLPRAYPNYFADTQMFVQLLRQTLSGRRRRIISTPRKLA